MAILFKHVNEPVPPPLSVRPDLDARLGEWLESLLAKDHTARPSGAETAWYSFEEIVGSIVGSRWRRLARVPELEGQAPLPPDLRTPATEVLSPAPESVVVPEPVAPTPPPVVPPAIHEPAARPSRRGRWIAAAAAIGAVGAAAVLAFVLLGGSDGSAKKPGKRAQTKYLETFSDPSDSWFPAQHHADDVASFDQGGYLVKIPKANGQFTASHDFDPATKQLYGKSTLPPGDARLSVDVTKLRGPNENTYGLLCSSNTTDDEYDLLIDGSGYAAIYRWDGKKSITLRDWKKSPAIFTGATTNHITAECRGGRTPGRTVMTLAVNGREIARAVEAHGAPVTYFGLYAATYDGGRLEVLFDNFALTRL